MEVSGEKREEDIFEGNAEYQMILEALKALQTQLLQAEKDLATLEELKVQALADPVTFLHRLFPDPGAGTSPDGLALPAPQNIHFLPPIQLSRHKRRFISRTQSQRYEQNFDYLMGRVMELQRERPMEPMTALHVRISASPVSSSVVVGPEKMLNYMRIRMHEIVGGLPRRPASLPAIGAEVVEGQSVQYLNDGNEGIFSPQPRKAQSIHFSTPILPTTALTGDPSFSSRSSSPLVMPSTSASASTSPKKRRKMLPGNDSAHHNLPWTATERQKMNELLRIYPEEEVQARRWAKIAAAMGTRTAGQVANRYNKMVTKRRRMLRKASNVGGEGDEYEYNEDDEEDEYVDIDDNGADDDTTFEEAELEEKYGDSKEYQEYLRLKKALTDLTHNPTLMVHYGFKCDGCGMEPIVGVRWHCVKCPSIDLCEECQQDGHVSANTSHRKDHRLIRYS